MDGPSIYDDEVIADSEDEESRLIIPAPKANARALLQGKIAPEITQDTILSGFHTSRAKPSPISSISNPTTSSSVPKPRPKPRPLGKKDDADADATSSSNISPPTNSTFASDFHVDADFSTSNIADRAKMRSRNVKSQAQQFVVSMTDVIELSSEDDDDFNLLPPSKARRKAAGEPKAGKAKATGKSKSVSDDVDTPDPKRRPRPRPLGKSKQGKGSDPISPLPGAISQQTDSMPTSSIPNDQFPIPFKLLPSQLPPSDPPTSTATMYDHPPIVTLPQLDTDPPSSPSSLFSVYASGKKKRKRLMSNIDELDSDREPGSVDVDTRRMPPPPLPGPPPTFFAGSSSPSVEVNHPVYSTSAGNENSTKKTPATKKPRKKKVIEAENEDAAWGTSRTKAKSKPNKTPAKKVAVVIEQRKGKGKAKEKEVFKSREFIDDDEDDDTIIQDVAKPTSGSKKPETLTSLSSVPDSDIEDAVRAGPSKKRKSVDRDLAEVDANGMEEDHPEPKRRTTIQGKGKRRVVSDDEDETQNPAEPASYKETPAKASGKGKGKDKPAKAKKTPKSTAVADSDIEDSTEPSNATEEAPSSLSTKENVQPAAELSMHTPTNPKLPVKPESLFPSLSSRYTIAPRTKSTPMSDLIRRVNSKPGSPFCSPAPRGQGSAARPSTPGTAYSPYVKASRSALSRIAPLHPNRRTPPPPLPPPPPKKKTKKELEREEQWEEELVESVGGITEWACMSDAERKEMRRAKREREMYGWED